MRIFPRKHSHKKQKDSLETQAFLFIFSLELEISEVVVQKIHKQQQKLATFVRDCSVKMTLRLFQSLSVVVTIVPTLLRQFRRSLQIKTIITNAPNVI